MGASVSRRRQARAEPVSALRFRTAKSFGDYVQLRPVQAHDTAPQLLDSGLLTEVTASKQPPRCVSLTASNPSPSAPRSGMVTSACSSRGSPPPSSPQVYTIRCSKENESSPKRTSEKSRRGTLRWLRVTGDAPEGQSKEPFGGKVLEAPARGLSRSFDLEDEKAVQSGFQAHKPLQRMYSMDRITDDEECRSWFPSNSTTMLHSTASTLQATESQHSVDTQNGTSKKRSGSIGLGAKELPQTSTYGRATARTRCSFSGSSGQSRRTPLILRRDFPIQVRPDPRFSFLYVVRTPSQEEGTRAGGKVGLRDPVVDVNSVNWDAEKEAEANACKGADFIPPKVMLISSKVPKAEYIPTIIRRDDPSIIAILYDHEHASFTDIIEEIERKLNEYHRGCRAWKLLLYCQGGPGYLYLLKNKVVTFAKLEKEEDLILFWKCLGGLMSKMNPEVNVINIMGCYVLGNQNGEKLFESLLAILHPYHTALEAPLELSAQGKKMIETYFNLRLYKLWRVRQHSRMANNFDDIV